MSSETFDNIVELISSDNFAFVVQGLELLENCLDNSQDDFFWDKILEIEASLKHLHFDYENDYPLWLPKGPHRRYVALWVLGYRAKCKDPLVKKVTEISLNNPAFTSLPSILKHHTDLEKFELQRSSWTSVDDIWDAFPNLKVLDLFDNELTSLPDSIGRCSNLHTLNLSANPLAQLPECVRSLKGLEVLRLRYTKFSTLPDWISELRSLHTIALDSSDIQRLPETIGQLSKLKLLDLSSSQITGLPQSIGQLASLEKLNLVGTRKLKGLPDSIGDCTALMDMRLPYHHTLEYLPSTLRVLDCGQRILLPFWDVLSTMSALEKAIISKENHKNPEQLSFENGEELDFGWWPNLKHLEIRDGNFNLETLSACTKLEYLEIRSGRQQCLPDSIGACTNLKTLDLRHSGIGTLPASISSLDKLEKLTLNDKFDATVELEKLNDVLYNNKTVDTEVIWQLNVDGVDTHAIESKRQRIIAKEFSTLKNRELLEKIEFRLDADTPLPDISECSYLDSITIYSDGEIPLSHLTNLKVGSCLQTVNIQADLPAFPTAQIRELLGSCEYVSEKWGSGRRHRFVFERTVSMADKWKTELENLRLQIADECGALKEMPEFSWYEETLPDFVGRMTGLRELSCSKVKSRNIPIEVLHLPNLESIESADSDYPNGWPIWTVDPSEVADFQYLDELYQNTRILNMKGCMLTEVPKDILGYTKLRRLDLSFNCLRTLPDAYPKWQNLQEISLAGNPLESLPDALLSLPNLRLVKLPKRFDLSDFQSRFSHIEFSHL